MRSLVLFIQTGNYPNGQIKAEFAAAQPILDRYASKGLIHKNKAARSKSRLNAAIKAL